jgi:hypothetical protein
MPKKNKDKEAPEKDKKEEIKDDAPPAEEGEKGEKAGDDKKPQPQKKKSGKIKWIIISVIVVIGVIAVASGIGYVFMPERFHNLFKKEFKGPEIILEDNLTEANISPFFVPPGQTEKKTIRIDLTIVWDGIASLKYKNNELNARNMMSERFNKFAGAHQDLNVIKSDMENEIGSMLRTTLGVQNLLIRIKEIRYF